MVRPLIKASRKSDGGFVSHLLLDTAQASLAKRITVDQLKMADQTMRDKILCFVLQVFLCGNIAIFICEIGLVVISINAVSKTLYKTTATRSKFRLFLLKKNRSSKLDCAHN